MRINGVAIDPNAELSAEDLDHFVALVARMRAADVGRTLISAADLAAMVVELQRHRASALTMVEAKYARMAVAVALAAEPGGPAGDALGSAITKLTLSVVSVPS